MQQCGWTIFTWLAAAAFTWGVAYSAPSHMLVRNQQDLAACLADATVQQCVLKAPIKIDPAAWRGQFPDTKGAAVITPQRANLTITAGMNDNDNSGSVVAAPERLGWSAMAGVIALKPGSQLQISNLDMSNFALTSDYVYSPATPYQSVGSGVSIWPTINVAPNSTFLGHNIVTSFTNPSTVDDCPTYVGKLLAYQIQAFGTGNASVVSPTAVLLKGPIVISMPVRNGSTGEYAGDATAKYENATVVCVESAAGSRSSSGQQGAAATALLAAVLLAALPRPHKH